MIEEIGFLLGIPLAQYLAIIFGFTGLVGIIIGFIRYWKIRKNLKKNISYGIKP